MIVNVGLIDRTARLIFAFALLTGQLDAILIDRAGLAEEVVWWIGIAVGFTAVFRVCPVYRVFGLDTSARETSAPAPRSAKAR